MKYETVVRTAFTLGGSLAAYEIVHGIATYATKFLEIGEVAGGLAAGVTLVLGYYWVKRSKE